MKRIATIFILLILLAIPTHAVFAQGYYDKVVGADEVIDDDLVVFSGNLTINEGAVITGDVVVMSGNARIAGTVEGDITLFSGNLETTETAVIEGNCVLFSGNFDGFSDSASCTRVSSSLPTAFNNLPNFSGPRPLPERGLDTGERSFLGNFFRAVGSSLLMAGFAFVVAAFAPRQLSRAGEAARSKALVSGTVGLLTAVAIPSIIAILAPISAILVLACGIGLLGVPIIIALAAALVVGALFGWIAIGGLLGEKLARWLNVRQTNLPIFTALGTAVLTFIIRLLDIGLMPGGSLVGSLIMCVGLGAAALTQFGTKRYPRLSSPTAVVSPLEDSPKFRDVFDTLPDDPSDLK